MIQKGKRNEYLPKWLGDVLQASADKLISVHFVGLKKEPQSVKRKTSGHNESGFTLQNGCPSKISGFKVHLRLFSGTSESSASYKQPQPISIRINLIFMMF